jgi:hypothetical protein
MRDDSRLAISEEKRCCCVVKLIVDAIHAQDRHGNVLGPLYDEPSLHCPSEIQIFLPKLQIRRAVERR